MDTGLLVKMKLIKLSEKFRLRKRKMENIEGSYIIYGLYTKTKMFLQCIILLEFLGL